MSLLSISPLTRKRERERKTKNTFSTICVIQVGALSFAKKVTFGRGRKSNGTVKNIIWREQNRHVSLVAGIAEERKQTRPLERPCRRLNVVVTTAVL